MVEAFALRNWFPPLVPLLRRTLMDAEGGFDESIRLTEDWDYWIRCTQAGAFGYLPGALVIYRMHGAQAHLDNDRMFLAGKRILSKHFRRDLPRYERALASWYEQHAKARWNAAHRMKTGLFLALAAYHSRIAAAAKHLAKDEL